MEQKNILILIGVVFLILAGYMVVNSLMDKANQEKFNASTEIHLIHHYFQVNRD